MMSRTKTVTVVLTERQAELTVIALSSAIRKISDNPAFTVLNKGEDQKDRMEAYNIILGLLPRGYQKDEEE